jgi:hypothetical protein
MTIFPYLETLPLQDSDFAEIRPFANICFVDKVCTRILTKFFERMRQNQKNKVEFLSLYLARVDCSWTLTSHE